MKTRPSLTIVVIADDSPANRWLLPQLERQHPLHTVIRPDWSAPRPTARTSSRRASPGHRLRARIRRTYFDARDTADAARLARLLFHDRDVPALRAPVWTVPAWDINSADVEHRLASIAPDLVLVSGAPILRPNIFDIARFGTLNLHFGIMPDYRGMHTIVTPLQRADYAHVGATVQRVVAGVDTGPALVRLYPALAPGDDHVSAERKILDLAATELDALLAWCSTLPDGAALRAQVLDGAGQLIRFVDRSIRADLRARLVPQHVPHTSQRVERYYDT